VLSWISNQLEGKFRLAGNNLENGQYNLLFAMPLSIALFARSVGSEAKYQEVDILLVVWI
jgi:hypothetical protein